MTLPRYSTKYGLLGNVIFYQDVMFWRLVRRRNGSSSTTVAALALVRRRTRLSTTIQAFYFYDEVPKACDRRVQQVSSIMASPSRSTFNDD